MGDEGQLIAEDCQFIADGMAAGGLDVGGVKFVEGFGYTGSEERAIMGGEEVGGKGAGDFAVKPHLKLGDGADGLGHRDAVRGEVIEAGVVEGMEEAVGGPVEATRASLADEGRDLWRRTRAFDEEVVLDQAAPAALVADDADAGDFEMCMGAEPGGEAPLKLKLHIEGVEGLSQERHGGVGDGGEGEGRGSLVLSGRLRAGFEVVQAGGHLEELESGFPEDDLSAGYGGLDLLGPLRVAVAEGVR
jgi:hypothetical protein